MADEGEGRSAHFSSRALHAGFHFIDTRYLSQRKIKTSAHYKIISRISSRFKISITKKAGKSMQSRTERNSRKEEKKKEDRKLVKCKKGRKEEIMIN